MQRFFPCAVVLAMTVLAPLTRAAEHRDTVHLDRERQTIDNFGASDCWVIQILDDWPTEKKEELAKLLFSKEEGLGLSCWRFTLGGGINDLIERRERTAETFETGPGTYDWTQQATEQWFLRKSKEYGVEHRLAFVNSPPGRMTISGHTYQPGPEPTNMREGMEDDFAAYMCDILEHFRDEGLPFHYISPINEPQIAWDGPRQEGNRCDNATIKRILLALHEELRARGLDTEMAAVESNTIRDLWRPNRGMTERYQAEFGDYLRVLAGDPAIRPTLDGRLSYHVYGNNRLGRGLIENRVRLAEEMQQYPDLDLWMSEYCLMNGPNGESGNGRDLTMTTALWVARIMHVDLTIADVTAWHWWLALSHYDYKDGLIYTDFVKDGDPQNIIIPKRFYTFAGFSRYVRPGMVRVELTGPGHDIEGLMASAYKDAAQNRLVAVYINMAEEPQRVTLDVDGVTLRSLTSYTTSDAEADNLRPTDLDPAAPTFDVPARATVTLVADY